MLSYITHYDKMFYPTKTKKMRNAWQWKEISSTGNGLNISDDIGCNTNDLISTLTPPTAL